MRRAWKDQGRWGNPKERIMLVLSRKSMQCVEIGNCVVVTVLEIRGNRVRLGIDAPKEIAVLRTELQKVTSAPATAAVSFVE
jgi:carbon storage regulator